MAGESRDYDIIIIGGGPAGLAAGIYAGRDRHRTLLMERWLVGGQIINAEWLENFPGFPEGIGGAKLGELMHVQATNFGLATIMTEVTALRPKENQNIIETSNGNYRARAVIIAGGCHRQKLDVPGEVKFAGKGVSYCATCDGAFFRDKPVTVVGGGNSALVEAHHLTKFASRVTVIHRRDQLRATPVVQEKARSDPKIDFLLSTVVDEILGNGVVSRLRLRDVKTGEASELKISGVFISVGLVPNTDYLKGVVALDENGAIITDIRMETNLPGVFAAGDIRNNSPRQVIAAAGDGAIAAMQASRFLG